MAEPTEVDLGGVLADREAEEAAEEEREDLEREREVAKRLEEEFRHCDLDLVEEDSFAGRDEDGDGPADAGGATPRGAAPAPAPHFLTSTPFGGGGGGGLAGLSLEEGALGPEGETPRGDAHAGVAPEDDERKYLRASESLPTTMHFCIHFKSTTSHTTKLCIHSIASRPRRAAQGVVRGARPRDRQAAEAGQVAGGGVAAGQQEAAARGGHTAGRQEEAGGGGDLN